MTGIEAIIFDADGTLVDSEVMQMDTMHELACGLGLCLTREQAHERFRGARMADCVNWIGAQLAHMPPGFEQAFTIQVRQLCEARFRKGLNALPGAHELLARLRMPFCVATNGPRDKVELTLSLTGLRPFLGDRVFCGYEIGSFKPAPDLFLHAAAVLGALPSRCAVVEDSLPGLQAGLAAGMQVFSLLPRDGVAPDIAERVTFINSLGEFDRLLLGQNY